MPTTNSRFHAYDAADLSNQFYASTSTNDAIGRGVVFTVPLVINGNIYVGSEGQVTVFGLK